MNQRFQNVQWAAEDATQMQLPPDSADVVFSNWLLMYLNDAEVAKLAADSILWVRPLDPKPYGFTRVCLSLIRERRGGGQAGSGPILWVRPLTTSRAAGATAVLKSPGVAAGAPEFRASRAHGRM